MQKAVQKAAYVRATASLSSKEVALLQVPHFRISATAAGLPSVEGGARARHGGARESERRGAALLDTPDGCHDGEKTVEAGLATYDET